MDKLIKELVVIIDLLPSAHEDTQKHVKLEVLRLVKEMKKLQKENIK